VKLTFLAELTGSRAAEAVLLHIFHYGESYGRAISSDLKISLDSVQRQLDKLEGAGLLVCKRQGRTLIYTWNTRKRAAGRLKDLVEIAYEGMSLEERETRFPVRRRPRSKDKPIIYSKP
jgi:DNA-binding transcriptional ArsR family regulator